MSTGTDAARLDRRRGVQADRPLGTPGHLRVKIASAAWLGLGAVLGIVISLGPSERWPQSATAIDEPWAIPAAIQR
jgi:hypothetical protein